MLIEKRTHVIRVAAVNNVAQKLNIHSGLAFADARARAPNLVFEEIDRVADIAALHKLAGWMVRFSPCVSVDGEDGLIMDVTGISHLFGSEKHLAEEVRNHLKTNNYISHIAIAGTPGAANALAHFRAKPEEVFICEEGCERQDIAALPVQSLRLSLKTDQLLGRLGLNRVEQLYGLDRRALVRRFASREVADSVVIRLDQALGHRNEPIKPLISVPEWSVRLACPEPVIAEEGIRSALDQLLVRLCDKLANHGLGARDYIFYTFSVDGKRSHIEVSSAQVVCDVVHIKRLFHEHIDKINPEFGIDLCLLCAGRTEALASDIIPLSAEITGSFDETKFIQLADRLAARLGKQAVQIMVFQESYIPERAQRFVPFEASLMKIRNTVPMVGPRPLRIFDTPEQVEVMAEVPDGPPAQLLWRRVIRKIVRADGPERIAPEWWKLSEKGARARDYYRIEDEDGRRYWIYRNGLYDDNRGGPPQWYMHGMFA